ncbi:membrane bound O-acyl transferase family-domain-containing protein [Mycena epipterygia]|nr:membrane bound O-acyl transferase family-domain-containing protein [Mycena epipterygia]
MLLTTLFVWKPFPYAYTVVYLALIITPLIMRPSAYRQFFFAPILWLTWRLVYDGQAGYVTSTFWFTCLLMASDYILLTDVQRELHQSPHSAPSVDSTSLKMMRPPNIEHAPLVQRVKWALTLFFNVRGVGWTHQPRALPPPVPPNTPRTKFIARQLSRFCVVLLLFDLVNLHARWNPAFRLRTGMAAAGLVWRVVGTVAWAVGAAAGLSLAHYAASIVCVALGVSRPQDWPPLFGDWADVASIRTFWARGWHQSLRRSLGAHGDYISRVLLRLPPGSVAALWVQICTAFALSGVVHYLAESVALGPAGRSGSLIFFGIQPAAIALEMFVAALSRRAGVALPPAISRALGYVWVFGWFCATLPIMQDPLIQAGEMASRVNASLIMGVLLGTWSLPPDGI